MSERMTWEQIREKYPDQWIGLKDVEYEDNGVNVISAVVADSTSSGDDLTIRMLKGEKILATFTTPDTCNFLPLGAVELFL